MIPILMSVACGLLIYYLQRHSIPTLALICLSLVPIGFVLVLGFLGMMVGILFTAAMAKVDLIWA